MIIDILRHTPPWVFVLFALLVALGVRQAFPHGVPATRLVVLPVAMTGLSLYGLFGAFALDAVAFGAWGGAFAATIAIGLARPTRTDVQYSPATRSFRLPGSWLPLALMMAIFFVRYVTAVSLAMHPALAGNDAFVAMVATVYGFTSGCFATRALRIAGTRSTHDTLATTTSSTIAAA